jgi:hypothetical protein
MKLTPQRLKNLIRKELKYLNESSDHLEKLRTIARTGPEGYKQAQELARSLGIDNEEIVAAAAEDFETRKQMFALPYGQRPKAAIEYEIDKTIEDIKNAKTPREKHILEDYLEGLEEELLEY